MEVDGERRGVKKEIKKGESIKMLVLEVCVGALVGGGVMVVDILYPFPLCTVT